ncbi:non-ribosomal peptide synthetase [Xenorhabdus ishibashii]|uniref:Amino acid adenylation n=1 Tax=Xenorhabdus ishibashii TaxID=1034471 RepID=A0A2D0KC25_9GAMM|nr:Amino acid adenylation [Xenorhabdus ishibashii]
MPMSCNSSNNIKFPLSSPQQVIWLDQCFRPHSTCYNLGSVILVEGKLDETLLVRAVETVVYRHDALRLRLVKTQEAPLQELTDISPVSVTIHDFSGYADAEEQAEQYIRTAFMRPFDLHSELWRFELLRVSDNRWYWQFCCHQLIGDIKTLRLISEEITNTYIRLSRGKKFTKAAPSYLDFINEDHTYLNSPRYLQDQQFWSDRYKNLPPALIQPSNLEKIADSEHPEPLIWQLDKTLFQRIEDIVAAHGLSVLHFMYAALACYFSRTAYSLTSSTENEDIVIGIPIDNRKNSKQRHTAGMFSSVIPIGITISPHDTFLDVMDKTAAELRRCYKHQRFPIEEINRLTQIQQQTGRAQLFDITLSFGQIDVNADIPNATLTYSKIQRGASSPLTIAVHQYVLDNNEDAQKSVTLEFHFSPDYLSRAEVIALQARLMVLIEAALTSPETQIQNLSILPQTEQQQLLVDFNATQRDFPQQTLIHQLIEAQTAKTPNATAVVCGELSLSYEELNQHANRLAHHLIALGVQPDDRVALCVERSLEMMIGFLAILKAGGAYVPLDPAYPAERLVYMLEDAAPVALLTQAELTKSEWLAQFNTLPTLLLDNPEPNLVTQPTDNPNPETLGLASHHLAYVIYTSGSTGQPKGVMIEHQSLCNLIATQQPTLALTTDSRVLQFASNSFDASIWECCMALMAGARLYLAQRASLLPGAILSRYLADQAISHVLLSPTALAAMDVLPDTLQTLLVGGEACPPTLVKRWSSGRQMLNAYGPTEITVCATLYSCASSDDSSADNPPPIGRPIANTRVYILNAHGQPVPRGVAGEIYIGGVGVARGYLNRPELTAERFLTDPFSRAPNARMYKTGDLGRWLPDGNIDYLGRNDFQVKLRGFRIELGEIESRLTQCDGVHEAVVIAREDAPGQKRLVAYLLPQKGVELVPAALRQQLAQHLAEYMLPSAFVTLHTFPLTPNGKLDRQALPAPDLSAVVVRDYVAPVGEIEIILAQIWQALLGLEQVGRYDHFFELGGHSLLATQLAARVRQRLAKELPLQQLFEQPVLMDLAQTLTNTSTSTQVTISIVDHSQLLPLSFAQQRLWFLAQLDPAASRAYHIPVALRLTGQLNRPVLTRAFDHLIARHESLRTRFVLVSGQPCQHIDPADIGFTLPYQDLRPLAPEMHSGHIADLSDLEAQTSFDFTQDPLIRGHLLQLADEEHVLLLTQHHIITDGWSVGVMMHELSVLYRALLDDQDAPLAPLPIQYSDYAVWQRDWLQDTMLTAQRDFWFTQLAGAPALLSLPTDRPRPAVQSFVGDRVPVHIDADLLVSLKKLGLRHNTTLFMTVLSAWSLVLARLSGQDDIVIGTPVANRLQHELEGLIGFFVNTLALRVTLNDAVTVTDLFAQVRERALAAYAHQDLPFEQVVEALQPERNLSYSPIFQVMLALNNTPVQVLTLPDVQCTPIEQMSPNAHFDLTLSLTETEAGLVGELEYVTDLFDTTTVERIVGYFNNVLAAMTADDTQRIATLPMLPDPERQQLLVDFNATQADFPQEALIHQLFEAQAAQHPEAIAVVFEAQTLSYGELNHRANQLAHYLITLGVRPDDRVALCAERSPEMVIGLLAILKAGGAYVPLDPAYPAERLVYMLEDAAPVALLTQAELAKSEWLTQFNALPTLLLDNPEPCLTTQPTGNPEPHTLGLASRHLAYVIYTSGSTGQPKGVMIEHQSLCNLIATQQPTLSLTADSRVLQFASNSFDASIWECCMALMAGARLCLAQRASLLPGAILSGYLADQAISHVLLSPTALAAMDSLPDTLQTLLVGGEACPPTLVKRWSSGRQMLNAYGPTEITVCATLYSCASSDGSSADNPPPIGRPIANTRIYILDAHGQPVPRGVAGEIYIAGAGVARGYLNRPELTAERFLADPFSSEPDARMYKTGDLGRWLPDGNIEYQGRNDFQVKLRGFRIELGEIESRLTQCDGVREAVVIAREDGSGQKQLIAYLRPEEGVELVPADLRQQLAQHLADYMLPSAFVTLEAFPLTPNGKLDRQALPAPDLSAIVTRGYEAPVGETEIALAQIWQKLLGLTQVSRHDQFFELGGHSLMIVSLVEELRQLGWQLEVPSVFASPILTDMAQTIQRNTHSFVVPPNLISEGCTAITPDMLPLVSLSQSEIDTLVEQIPGGANNIQDIYPLAPLQEGILFHHLLQTQGDDYLLRIVLACSTREHLDNFLGALQQVIDRHDILRTAVYWQNLARPVQVVWRQALLAIHEFIPATTDDIPTQLLAHTDPLRHRINLNQAPLFAADITHDPAQDEWLLALRFHHLVNDHMTSDLIFAEIAQILRGNAADLPAMLPYRNFIAQTLSVPVAEHETYFRTRLADIDEPTAPFGILSIPSDSDNSTVNERTINERTINENSLLLDPALAKAIRSQARRLGVSPSVLFHVAWAQVVAQTSGRDDVVFGSVLLGRLQGGAGADRILGMFINTLPLRISLGGRTVHTIVQETYHNLTALLEHEQAPLALAQRCSGVAQPMPLFSALLNYRHSPSDQDKTTDISGTAMRLVAAEERTNYPITLSVDDLGDNFELTALTVTNIAAERITTYLATAINGLVTALVHHPQQLILDVPILPESERQQLLVGFNTTQRNFPQKALIHQLVETQALQHPQAPAVTYEGQTVSYHELNQRANQLAHYLIAQGVRPDDRVALCIERSPEMVVGLLAILKAGGAYVPLNPNYPIERLTYMLKDAAPVVLLTLTAQLNTLPNTVPTVLLDHLLDHEEPMLATQPTDNPDAQILGLKSHHLAYVIYTSGSTGQPKGVMVEHRNVLRLIINNGFADINAHDCVAHCANIAFDASTWEIWSALLNGARLHVVPQSVLLDPIRFCDSLIKGQVTALWLTVGLFNEYLDSLKPLFGQLRYLLIGGDVLDPRKIQQVQLAASQPVHLINGYGPTETTTFAATYEIVSPVDVSNSIPIGHPIANTQIYILDTQGQPVPLGVAGEIYIAGAGVARGYLNLPELTTERFLTDPFSRAPNARMYKTGDLGRWLPDGNIDYLGRNDFQVKLRGFRIELGEIESRLTQCDGVHEAVVIAREDAPGQKRLVAYLLPQKDVELVPATLRQQLAQHLTDYMLPSAFISLDAFPLTPNGKLDRQALPTPDLSAVVAREYAAPVGEAEIALAQIWQDLLELEQVGRYDHFFELGGHSLLAVQLAARIRQHLARELSLQSLFDQPRLIDLAQELTETSTPPLVTLSVANRNQPLPLSFAQQRLWFLAQLDPAASRAYHIPVALRLTGQLNRPVLTRAFDHLIARHESLRTRFVLVSGQPCQHIDPADIGFTLPYQDLRPLAPEMHSGHIADLSALEAQTSFDFTQDPLIRGHLLQLADEEHVLLLTQHHIITDGWSVGVMMHELSVLYRALLDDQDAPLAPLPIQYVDYAIWQRGWLQGTVIAKQRDFWCSQLEGAPALLTLPTDRPRPAVQTYVGGRVPVHFDASLLTSLKELGQRHQTTLFMTVLSAWSLVLARLSGQDDIVIGTPVANRPHYELEGMIGFFVNTLALRVTLDDSICVADLLAQVREKTLAAYAHQDLPFEQVVETLQPERSLSYSPIFQVMLALNNTPVKTLTLPDLQLTQIEQVHYSTHFDMTLSLTETESGLSGELIYAVDLFDPATIKRMIGYLKQVLVAITRDAEQAIASMPILSASERHQLLVEFNATQADFPQEALIHQLVEAQAAKTPSAIAVVCDDQSLSYGELNRYANDLAHHLMMLGVHPDDRIAICVERNVAMVVGLLAILKAGGAYVPLDPAYPTSRLAYMLEDAAPVVVITQKKLTDRLTHSVPTVFIDNLLDNETQGYLNQSAGNPDAQGMGLTSNHLAYVIYTSGSTGLPKGVAITHRNTVNFLTWAQRTFSAEALAHTLFATSFNFDLSVYECFAPLISGGTVHLVSDALSLITTKSAAEQRLSLINTVPSAITHLSEANAIPPTVKTINLAGEALKSHIVEHLFAHSAVEHICNLYGPSETTTYSTWTCMDRTTNIVSHIGRPIANTQIYILDTTGQPVPLGVTGEIYIGGAGVSRGYLNRPELTAERFLPDPFVAEPNARMYKTGDLGRWLPDGNIEYLGRNDFQVKLRGFRIELGEIEARLTQCDGVREAVVIAREDEPGQKRLVAYLRPEEGAELVPAELRQQLAQHLSDYMLPSAFVTLDTFPLTPNGKLDRKALPAPDLSAVVARSYEAPVGETEIALAQIWQNLLGLKQVSRHDQFFELGGHSLMIVSLIEELRQLGWQLEVRSVFASPVLTDMALAIQHEASTFVVPPNRIPENCTTITPDMLPLVSLSQSEIETIVEQIPGGASNVQDIYPLAPLQEGILFHHLLQTQGDNYLLQSLLAFNTRERLDDFLAALQHVIDRHDILRTAVYWQAMAQPVQVVWRQAPLPITVFTPATVGDVVTQLKCHTDPRQHRINLNHAPLFAADIAHDPAQNEWLLALRFHHLVSDHMTLELILAEIALILQGETASLPAVLPYRNFIAQTLATPTTEHEAYFRAQLADIDEPTAPFGVLKVSTDNNLVTEARLPIAPDLAKTIRTQARRLGVSPGVLFHVAWAQVLAQTSGRDDVVFGSVLLGRLQGGAGADQILGMFINTLPIRISLGERTVQEIVQDTYHNLTALLEHEQAPLVLAQQCSGVAQPMPLFSSLLNYRHSPSGETEGGIAFGQTYVFWPQRSALTTLSPYR